MIIRKIFYQLKQFVRRKMEELSNCIKTKRMMVKVVSLSYSVTETSSKQKILKKMNKIVLAIVIFISLAVVVNSTLKEYFSSKLFTIVFHSVLPLPNQSPNQKRIHAFYLGFFWLHRLQLLLRNHQHPVAVAVEVVVAVDRKKNQDRKKKQDRKEIKETPGISVAVATLLSYSFVSYFNHYEQRE